MVAADYTGLGKAMNVKHVVFVVWKKGGNVDGKVYGKLNLYPKQGKLRHTQFFL